MAQPFAPPSSMFFSGSRSLALPPRRAIFLSLTRTLHQSTQVISLQIGIQLVSETHQDGEQKSEMGIA